ncbi:hypothetical protein KpnM6E1_gp126 [Klebsiella phage KpnM6E1]|nr:hypothetical protein KpnM6E1_gp126 [Klebsiella phage KpnM6E1]
MYFNYCDRNLTDHDLEHGFGLNPIQLFLLKSGQQIVLKEYTLERIDMRNV